MDPAPKTTPIDPVSLGEEVGRIAAEYPGHSRRESLAAVVRLRRRLAPSAPLPVIGVVGTNGKTSTATYLARLLSASGVRTGLYVSPHLTSWTERVRVDDVPCDPRELIEALTSVHEIASSGGGDLTELRFFDILTLAAELTFSRAGVSAAVFEAGIGGRLDAVRVLEPHLVLLTSVGIDHAEILGEEPSEILEEKLLVAPHGATVLTFRLGAELDELASEIAARRELRIVWVEPKPGAPLELPAYLRSALTLAEAGKQAAAEILAAAAPGEAVETPPAEIDPMLPGRFERGERDNVPYVLDAAHNEAAWRLLAVELRRQWGVPPEALPYVALVSVSPAKRREGLAGVLHSMPGLDAVIATRHTALPAEDPEVVAEELRLAGLDARAVDDVAAATSLAFERAKGSGGRVLVFGSTHLVGDVRRLLAASSGSD